MTDHEETSPEVEAFLEHYGVKGMKWGIRKEDQPGVFRLQGATPTIDASLHSSTKTAAKEVAALMGARYGFQITAVKDMSNSHRTEYAAGTVGFVESTPGQRGGVVHVKPSDERRNLKNAEDVGWFAPETGNLRGFITHEAGHAMFHAEQSIQRGFFKNKVVGGNIEARDAAMRSGTQEAARAGIPKNETISRVSGYAAASGSREELEAELFSQYHWNPNAPSFVKAWGETLHREMGLDPTPFSEVVKNA